MNQKLVVLAHGIGDNAAGFSKEWEKILRKNHPKAKFITAEFVWEDILEEAEKQYPLCSKQAQIAFKRLGSACWKWRLTARPTRPSPTGPWTSSHTSPWGT